MTDILLISLIVLCVIIIMLLLLKKPAAKDDKTVSEIKHQFEKSEIKNEALISTVEKAFNVQLSVMQQNQLRVEKTIEDFSAKNEEALDKMRNIVDEKLAETLEKRLSSSYGVISENLQRVAEGIGEVNKLAVSVGDVKKIFSNVKIRGIWGEVQLQSMLSEMLTESQYKRNFRINPKVDSFVDFVVVMPDKTGSETYLPIDSKFPIEEYNRLISATTEEETLLCEKALIREIKKQADSIAEKYIVPPKTTDFAIMYFPIESLYAETVKNAEITEFLHKKRVIPCGPTNLGALLNSLQVGFKSVAIEKRSRELWQLLAVFKNEFNKFLVVLEKTGKKLQEAQENIELASKKSYQIERKLKNVTGEEEYEELSFLDEEEKS